MPTLEFRLKIGMKCQDFDFPHAAPAAPFVAAVYGKQKYLKNFSSLIVILPSYEKDKSGSGIDNQQETEETAFLMTIRDLAVRKLSISAWRKLDAASQMGLPLRGYSMIPPHAFRGDGQATTSVC